MPRFREQFLQLLNALLSVPAFKDDPRHAKASITLDIYSHLLGGEDNDAAKQAEEILRRVLKSLAPELAPDVRHLAVIGGYLDRPEPAENCQNDVTR